MKKRAKQMKKHNGFDDENFLHANKQRHLKELRKMGISHSKHYGCGTEAQKSKPSIIKRIKNKLK